MRGLVLVLCLLLVSFTRVPTPKKIPSFSLSEAQFHFQKLTAHSRSYPSWTCFAYAEQGYQKLVALGKINNPYLTVVDFSLPSTQKRLWVIDMQQLKVVQHTYVAHGRNSGWITPTAFSNIPESQQSSLGFYLTGATYFGKHGLAMKLKGMEPGFNDNAAERAIVMHGAAYVSAEHIQRHQRLGRSQGCPALSQNDAQVIIPTIQNGSCLFIYAQQTSYLEQSTFIAQQSI